jgi:hypothetical protein
MANFDVETEREINAFRIQERYISTMKWSRDSDEYLKTIVIGNIRGFYQWLYKEGFIDMDKVQEYFWHDNLKKGIKDKNYD